MEIACKIKNSVLDMSGAQAKRLSVFKKENDGKYIILKLDVIKDNKSLQQLRFYFGVLLPAFVELTGETNKSRLDAYFRDKYLSTIHEINGEQFKFIPSLQIGKNQVNKESMTKFIDNVINDLIDMGGSIDMDLYNEYKSVLSEVS